MKWIMENGELKSISLPSKASKVISICQNNTTLKTFKEHFLQSRVKFGADSLFSFITFQKLCCRIEPSHYKIEHPRGLLPAGKASCFQLLNSWSNSLWIDLALRHQSHISALLYFVSSLWEATGSTFVHWKLNEIYRVNTVKAVLRQKWSSWFKYLDFSPTFCPRVPSDKEPVRYDMK